MKKSYRHEEIILQEPVTAGIIASAVIGAASSSHQASEQKRIASKAEDKREAAAREAEEKALRIEKDTRPEGEGAGAIEFGSGDDTEVGNVGEFIRQKPSGQALGTSGVGSGLGTGFRI